MKNFIYLVLAISILLGLSIEKLSAATITWDGGGDGTTWSDAVNWGGDVLPGTGDDVDLDGNTVVLTASTQVQRVYAGGSSHLTINSGVTLTITGFAGDDDGLEVQGSATCINNGSIAISNITGGAAADGLYNKGTFTNNGSITIDGTGDHGIYAQDGTFTNSSGGTISITNVMDDHIIVDDNSGAPAIFNNNGTITITMLTGDDGIYVNDGATFNNSSIINLSAGVGASTDESIYTEDSGAFNNLSGGVVTISSGTDYGLQTKNNGVVTNAGTITIEQMPDHQIWMDGPGTFSNSGTINLNNSISGKNGLYVTDASVFTNDTTGQLNISNSANYAIQVDANGSTAEVVNNGTITITGGSNDGIRLQEVGKFTNNATGNLNITNAGDEGIQIDDGATPISTFNNSGTVTITTPGDHGMELFGTFNNLAGGTYKALDCPDDGIRMRNTGVFNNDGAIVINGSGSEDIETDADAGTTFSNTANATFAPGASPGLMEIKDDFDLGTATVTFEITGTTAITQYDQIQNFSAGNTMTISSATMHLDWGAYIPSIGDKFKVIDGSGTVSGPFATITTSNSDIVVTVDYSGDTNTEVEIEVTCINHAVTVPMDTTVCAGVVVPARNFTGTIMGATFAWTSSTDIGFGTSGSGDIAAFTATNTGTTAIIDTVIVTPTVSNCIGTPDTFTITVNPLPSVTAISNINVDAGATIPTVSFSGTTGATFNWTNDNTAIGLAANGIGDISAFTATNTSNAAISATVSVTPTLNGCMGTAQTFTITVNPLITVNCQDDDLMIASVTNGTDYVASNTITSDATIAATFQISYQAGQSITLQSGFHAEANSDFTASIAPCNTTNTFDSPEETSVTRNSPNNNNTLKSGLSMQVQPNPARSSIEINYHLDATSSTSIALYDLTGKQLKVLLSNQEQLKGLHQQQVDIADLKGGIYFVLLENEGQVLTKKLIVIE